MPHDSFEVRPCPSSALLALALAMGSGCGDPTGSDTGSPGATLVVSASTTGSDQDVDGYAVVVDGQAGRRVARNASLTLSDLEPGTHRVELRDVAPNCTVVGENPRSIEPAAGATVTMTFYVDCEATTGALTLHTVTTGEAQDPNGYAVLLDGQSSRSLGPNGSETFAGLAPGDHTVKLVDVITNCHLEGEATRTVTLQAGETAELTFSVACVGRTLHVSVGTSGRSPDPDGYTVAVDGNAPQAIGINGSLDVNGLVDGGHTVILGGLAAFCDAPPNPRTIDLSETNASVRFDVVCAGPPVDGLILFNGVSGDRVHVFVMRADGSRRTDLTPHADGFSAQWSPDRTRILFETSRNSVSEVFVMNADGSHPTRLAAGHSPAWSPDGARIAFIAGGGLTVMDVDGSHRHQLATGRGPLSPAWSPDGGRIAYAQENPARCGLILFDPVCARDLYVINADGTGMRQLTEAPDPLTWSTAPAWSPDGTLIAFGRSRFGAAGDLFLVAPDGTGLARLTADDDVTEAFPVWSPDGRGLAFARRTGAAEFHVALMPRQGGTAIPLLTLPGEQLATSWR